MSDFSRWLLEKYIEYIRMEGKPKSVTDFANHVGVTGAIMRQWFNVLRNPSENSIQILASKYGDEIYKAIGIEPPDIDIELVNESWSDLPKAKKVKIIEIIKSKK